MYTRNTMKRITAQWPLPPRTKEARQAAWIVAAMLTIMTVGQLFSFDKFIPLLDAFHLPGEGTGQLIAVTLVTCGVLALPFLLQMKLSIAMRWASMFAGWLVMAIWLFLSVWMNVSDVDIDNAGLVGASVTLIPGWWVFCAVLGLTVLTIWASWGLWPSQRKK